MAGKKVVHMTTVHHPYDPRIYHKECKSLQDAGYDVTLIAQGDPTEARRDATIKHIQLKTYPNRIKRMIFGAIDAYQKAKKLKADVYHFHDPELLPIGWLLKNKRNTVIYDIHEDYITSILQKDYMGTPAKKVIASIYKVMEKFFTKNMELCLAEKYYKDIYPEGTCILNYPTLDENMIEFQRNADSITDSLLYTGNVTHVRGALIHAKIPLIHPSVSVHYIGKCNKSIADEIYTIVKDKQEKIEIEGIDQFVEKEDIERKYVSRNWLAGIALFPPTEHYMKKELTKFFEYMSAGIPILCSDFPVWKNFVEKYDCGIAVDPYNEEEIKNAIDYLRNNPDEVVRMGNNGKEAVVNHLNWKVEQEKLVSWYHQLLA